jgi:hypothetical protein
MTTKSLNPLNLLDDDPLEEEEELLDIDNEQSDSDQPG